MAKIAFPHRPANPPSLLTQPNTLAPPHHLFLSTFQSPFAFGDRPDRRRSPFKWRFSTKLAAGLRSVARNYKATRLLTRPG